MANKGKNAEARWERCNAKPQICVTDKGKASSCVLVLRDYLFSKDNLEEGPDPYDVLARFSVLAVVRHLLQGVAREAEQLLDLTKENQISNSRRVVK